MVSRSLQHQFEDLPSQVCRDAPKKTRSLRLSEQANHSRALCFCLWCIGGTACQQTFEICFSYQGEPHGRKRKARGALLRVRLGWEQTRRMQHDMIGCELQGGQFGKHRLSQFPAATSKADHSLARKMKQQVLRSSELSMQPGRTLTTIISGCYLTQLT